MSDTKKIACTIDQARSIADAIDQEYGYPKAATLADQVGGGIHVPLALAGTAKSSRIDVMPDGSAVLTVAAAREEFATKKLSERVDTITKESFK